MSIMVWTADNFARIGANILRDIALRTFGIISCSATGVMRRSLPTISRTAAFVAMVLSTRADFADSGSRRSIAIWGKNLGDKTYAARLLNLSGTFVGE